MLVLPPMVYLQTTCRCCGQSIRGESRTVARPAPKEWLDAYYQDTPSPESVWVRAACAKRIGQINEQIRDAPALRSKPVMPAYNGGKAAGKRPAEADRLEIDLTGADPVRSRPLTSRDRPGSDTHRHDLSMFTR